MWSELKYDLNVKHSDLVWSYCRLYRGLCKVKKEAGQRLAQYENKAVTTIIPSPLQRGLKMSSTACRKYCSCGKTAGLGRLMLHYSVSLVLRGKKSEAHMLRDHVSKSWTKQDKETKRWPNGPLLSLTGGCCGNTCNVFSHNIGSLSFVATHFPTAV